MSLVTLLPLDLKREIVKYSDTDFIFVLEETKLFPISTRTFCCALMNYSARRGYLDLLKWSIKYGCRPTEMTCAHAAKGGHLEILKWLRKNKCPWNEWVCGEAAYNGHFEMLKWARNKGCPWRAWDCYTLAQAGGYFEISSWISKNHKSENNDLCLII